MSDPKRLFRVRTYDPAAPNDDGTPRYLTRWYQQRPRAQAFRDWNVTVGRRAELTTFTIERDDAEILDDDELLAALRALVRLLPRLSPRRRALVSKAITPALRRAAREAKR